MILVRGAPPSNCIKDFDVILKKRRGICLSQCDVLNHPSTVESEWIFYCEDDVLFKKLPTVDEFNKILNTTIGGRAAGMLCFWRGIFCQKGDLEKLVSNSRNKDFYHSINDTDSLWIMDRSCDAPIFVNFPACFIRRDLFVKILDYARKHFIGSNFPIEMAYTQAWYNLGFSNDYYAGVFVENPNQLISFDGDYDSTAKLFEQHLFIRLIESYHLYHNHYNGVVGHIVR